MKKLHALLALAVVTLAGCGKGGIQSPDFTPELTGVVITTAPPVTVPAGRTVQIEGVGVFTTPPGSDTDTFQDETDLEWTSSSESVATIDGNGLVTGVSEGTVTITAHKKDFSDTLEVTITAAVLTAIEVRPATRQIAKGQDQDYTTEGTYSDGSTGPVTSPITWTSTDETVATVVATGTSTTATATSVDEGTTTIRAVTENTEGETIRGNASLTVTPPTLVDINVMPASATVAAGRTRNFNTQGVYSDGTTGPITTTVAWVSSDTSVATVTTPGDSTTATGVAQGTAELTASTTNSLGREVSGSATLTVGAPVLTDLTVLPADVTIPLGTSQSYSVEGTYSDGSTGPVTLTLSWTSSDTGIATVAPDTGETTTASSLAEGLTNIRATTTNEEGDTVTGVTSLTVGAAVVNGLLSVSPDPADVPLGTTQGFTATGTFTDGSTGTVDDSQLDWSSSVEQVATIAANGRATALAQGTTIIEAKLKAGIAGAPRTAHATMNVTAPVLTAIVIQPPDSSLAAGTTVELRALGIYSDSPTPRDITGNIDCPGLTPPVTGPATVSWESGVTSVATVDPDTGPTTTVTGVAASPDPVEITASSVNESCVTIVGRANVTVTDAILVSLLRVEPATQFVREGLETSEPYVAIGEYSDASERAIENTLVDWTTGDNAIATIDADGVATGVAEGTTTITATLDAAATTDPGENRTADASLTVTDSECTTPLLTSNGADVFTNTAGLCLAPLCGVNNPENVADADPASFATINATLGLLGASATLGVNANVVTDFPADGTPAGFRIARPAGLLLSAELLSQVTVSTLVNGGVVESSDPLTNPLRVTLLGIGGDTEFALLSFVPTLPFNGLAITFDSGVASALTTVDVANACATVVIPDEGARLVKPKRKRK